MSDHGRGVSVDHLWADAAAVHSSRVLVQRGEERWTYGELFRASRAVAQWLCDQRVSRGDRVLIAVANGPEYVASYFGALAAGAIAVPVAPRDDEPGVAAAAAHCTPAAAVVERSRTGDVATIPHLAADRLWELLEPDRPIAANVTAGDEPTAQIIYTSGSAGRPKGVMLSHRNLVSNARAVLSYLQLGADDGVLAFLPFSYSYGSSVLLTHVAVGARLVVGDFVFPARAVATIDEQGLTGFSGVPSSFTSLLRQSDFARRRFRTLRYMTCAGGALSPDVAAAVVAAQPRIALHIMYGQTEAGPRLASLPPGDVMRKPGSVGVAVSGTTLTIRRADGAVCAPGESGEIYATGPGIMRGYWNDPGATSEVLTAHGLRTGDLGHVDEDGYLYVDGRMSGVIKSGGYRVNPEEIEAVLHELDGVDAAAVAGVPDERFGEAIAAFVQLRPGAHLDAEAVLRHARQRLPRHKQIRQVSFVERLPRAASGKLLRSRLADLVEPKS